MALDTTSKKMLAITDINGDLGYIPYILKSLPLYDVNKCLIREEIELCAEYEINPSKEPQYDYNELVPLCDIDKTNMVKVGMLINSGQVHSYNDQTIPATIVADIHLINNVNGDEVVKKGIPLYKYTNDWGTEIDILGVKGKNFVVNEGDLNSEITKLVFRVEDNDDYMLNTELSNINLEYGETNVMPGGIESYTITKTLTTIEISNILVYAGSDTRCLTLKDIVEYPSELPVNCNIYFTKSLGGNKINIEYDVIYDYGLNDENTNVERSSEITFEILAGYEDSPGSFYLCVPFDYDKGITEDDMGSKPWSIIIPKPTMSNGFQDHLMGSESCLISSYLKSDMGETNDALNDENLIFILKVNVSAIAPNSGQNLITDGSFDEEYTRIFTDIFSGGTHDFQVCQPSHPGALDGTTYDSSVVGTYYLVFGNNLDDEDNRKLVKYKDMASTDDINYKGISMWINENPLEF